MEKKERPKILDGVTEKVRTGCGNLYITMAYNNGDLLEVYATLGKAGGCSHCQNEALTRSVSLGLKYGVPVEEYIKELIDIRCPNPNLYPEGEKILSCPDGIARTLRNNLDGNNKK